MACDFGARTVHHYEGGGVTIRDPTMEQKDTFNIVSRRGYLSRCDQRDQRRESTKKNNKAGRMVMVLGTPDQLIYYLEYFLLEEPEQAARRTLSKRNITAAEW